MLLLLRGRRISWRYLCRASDGRRDITHHPSSSAGNADRRRRPMLLLFIKCVLPLQTSGVPSVLLLLLHSGCCTCSRYVAVGGLWLLVLLQCGGRVLLQQAFGRGHGHAVPLLVPRILRSATSSNAWEFLGGGTPQPSIRCRVRCQCIHGWWLLQVQWRTPTRNLLRPMLRRFCDLCITRRGTARIGSRQHRRSAGVLRVANLAGSRVGGLAKLVWCRFSKSGVAIHRSTFLPSSSSESMVARMKLLRGRLMMRMITPRGKLLLPRHYGRCSDFRRNGSRTETRVHHRILRGRLCAGERGFLPRLWLATRPSVLVGARVYHLPAAPGSMCWRWALICFSILCMQHS